jgi:hypothetical protein
LFQLDHSELKRHTFSTALFRAAVNPTIIAELDGHVAGGGKRRTTTEEVYIKSSEVMVLKEAVEKLDYGDVVDLVKSDRGTLRERRGVVTNKHGNHWIC